MLRRLMEKQVLELFRHFPAICILGPRQVGKTTLVKKLARSVKKEVIYLDLERDSDRLKLQDAESYLAQQADRCVIIDEVQFMPELYRLMRPLIDQHRITKRFIITGSASPEMIKGVSESLAGRIAYIELTPFLLLETGFKPVMEKHWFRGGFPLSYLARNAETSRQWLDHFIKSYLERDLNLIYNINFTRTAMSKLLTMLAHSHGNILHIESFARALGISGPTIARYLDFLEGAFIIHRLPAYSHQTRKRLVKSPKIYIRDSGVLHRLCRFNDLEDLKSNVLVGNSWEGYVIEQIHNALPSYLRMYYYRTQDGAETDVVLEKGNKVVACIEIKLSNSPVLSRGFYLSAEALKCRNNFLITPGSDDFTNADGIRYCSLPEFLKKYLKKM